MLSTLSFKSWPLLPLIFIDMCFAQIKHLFYLRLCMPLNKMEFLNSGGHHSVVFPVLVKQTLRWCPGQSVNAHIQHAPGRRLRVEPSRFSSSERLSALWRRHTSFTEKFVIKIWPSHSDSRLVCLEPSLVTTQHEEYFDIFVE